jgi:hypothetical protein
MGGQPTPPDRGPPRSLKVTRRRRPGPSVVLEGSPPNGLLRANNDPNAVLISRFVVSQLRGVVPSLSLTCAR